MLPSTKLALRVIASLPYPVRYRTRTLNKVPVTASVAWQSMQSGVMDCFTLFAMTNLFMERSVVTRQSVCGIDRIRLARNDGRLVERPAR